RIESAYGNGASENLVVSSKVALPDAAKASTPYTNTSTRPKPVDNDRTRSGMAGPDVVQPEQQHRHHQDRDQQDRAAAAALLRGRPEERDRQQEDRPDQIAEVGADRHTVVVTGQADQPPDQLDEQSDLDEHQAEEADVPGLFVAHDVPDQDERHQGSE